MPTDRTHARLNPLRLGRGEHRHSCIQILFGLGGVVRCEMDAGIFDVSMHSIGIVPRQAPHFFAGLSEESRLLVIDLYLEDDVLRRMARLDRSISFEGAFLQPRVFPVPAALRPVIDYATSQLKPGPCEDFLVAQQWATTFALQVQRLLGTATGAPDERFERFIDARLSMPPSNRELQRHIGMSGSALNQWCHRHYGLTPQQVVLRRRLDWASHRLRARPDLSIAQVAHEAGFADTPTFSRAFRRVYGSTPSTARQHVDD